MVPELSNPNERAIVAKRAIERLERELIEVGAPANEIE